MSEYLVYFNNMWVGSVYASSLAEAKKTAMFMYPAVMRKGATVVKRTK